MPIVNGFTTGGWVWNTWKTYHTVAYVDLFWLFTGLTALYLSFFVLKVKETTDQPIPVNKKLATESINSPQLVPEVLEFPITLKANAKT